MYSTHLLLVSFCVLCRFLADAAPIPNSQVHGGYGDGRRLDAKYLFWAGDPCDPEEPQAEGVCSTVLVSAPLPTEGMATPTSVSMIMVPVVVPTATPEPPMTIDP